MTKNETDIEALERNFWSQWAQFGKPDDCNFNRSSGVYRLETPVSSLPYNGVFRFEIHDNAEARIDELINHYENRNVDHLWVVHPSSAPANLDALLEARGIKEVELCSGMVAAPDDLKASDETPDGVEIHEIIPSEEAVVLEFVANRWSVPSEAMTHLQEFFRLNRIGEPGSAMRGWIATMDGRLVGKAFIHRSGNIAGLYGVATRPEARGKGVGMALCARALRESCVDGVDRLVLHSTPIAVSIYEKLGFRHVAPFRVFAPDGAFAL